MYTINLMDFIGFFLVSNALAKGRTKRKLWASHGGPKARSVLKQLVMCFTR